MATKFVETIVSIYLISIVLAILIIPAAGSASLWDSITGWATSSTTSLAININNAPQVVYVRATTPIVTITEDATTIANFTFLVQDLDGVGEIDNATVFLRVNLTGETDRMNYTCVGNGTVDANTLSYNCQAYLWFFDGYGNWTINVSARDIYSASGQNLSVQFEVYSTTAIQMGPINLTWPSLELGSSNRTSNNDPIIINNTGNKDIATGGVTTRAHNLQGIQVGTEFIDVRNFTVSARNGTSGCTDDQCFECNGTVMVNQSAQPIFNANISAGNRTLNDLFNVTNGPQETLFFCISTVPEAGTISRQTYATNGTHTAPWIISVS